jgi:acyl-CoA thioesterase-1
MEKNLGAMIERAQHAGARVLLIGMRMPPNYGPQYTGSFQAAFARLAKRYKTAFVPFLLEDFAGRQEYFQGDLMHPTEAAQPLIAARVWKALAPLLR